TNNPATLAHLSALSNPCTAKNAPITATRTPPANATTHLRIGSPSVVHTIVDCAGHRRHHRFGPTFPVMAGARHSPGQPAGHVELDFAVRASWGRTAWLARRGSAPGSCAADS